MVRVLPPWFENIRKRQVKAPKIYIRDSGIMHTLLQISTLADLQGHPGQLSVDSKFPFVIKIECILGSECIQEKHPRLTPRDILQ